MDPVLDVCVREPSHALCVFGLDRRSRRRADKAVLVAAVEAVVVIVMVAVVEAVVVIVILVEVFVVVAVAVVMVAAARVDPAFPALGAMPAKSSSAPMSSGLAPGR